MLNRLTFINFHVNTKELSNAETRITQGRRLSHIFLFSCY